MSHRLFEPGRHQGITQHPIPYSRRPYTSGAYAAPHQDVVEGQLARSSILRAIPLKCIVWASGEGQTYPLSVGSDLGHSSFKFCPARAPCKVRIAAWNARDTSSLGKVTAGEKAPDGSCHC